MSLLVLGDARERYDPFFQAVVAAVSNRRQPRAGTLGAIFDQCALDPAHREDLVTFAEVMAAIADSSGPSLEARFWPCLTTSRVRRETGCITLLSEFIEAKYLRPYGGYEAGLSAPPIEVIYDEVYDSIVGYPMLSGLSIYLLATLAEQDPDLASFGRTYNIIEATFPDLRVKDSDWLRKRIVSCHRVSPLWAGFLAVANCWNARTLLDRRSLVEMFCPVIRSSEKRVRLYSYAAWFAREFLPHHRSPRANAVTSRAVLELPPSVPPIKPTFRPLVGPALFAAKRYR
jgi:hypothetical protein